MILGPVRITEHLPGKHDQRSHGRKGSLVLGPLTPAARDMLTQSEPGMEPRFHGGANDVTVYMKDGTELTFDFSDPLGRVQYDLVKSGDQTLVAGVQDENYERLHATFTDLKFCALGGMDPGVKADIVDTLERLGTDHPEVARRLYALESADLPMGEMGRTSQMLPSQACAMQFSSGFMTQGTWASYTKQGLDQALGMNQLMGGAVPGPGSHGEYVATHEFGHMLATDHFGTATYVPALPKAVTDYGATDKSENFAEGFVAQQFGNLSGTSRTTMAAAIAKSSATPEEAWPPINADVLRLNPNLGQPFVVTGEAYHEGDDDETRAALLLVPAVRGGDEDVRGVPRRHPGGHPVLEGGPSPAGAGGWRTAVPPAAGYGTLPLPGPGRDAAGALDQLEPRWGRALARAFTEAYNPGQRRDAKGRWSRAGGGGVDQWTTQDYGEFTPGMTFAGGLDEAAAAIRALPYEVAVIEKDGRTSVLAVGETGRVGLPMNMQDEMKGSIMLHNHPAAAGMPKMDAQYHDGPSGGDVVSFVRADIAEGRVVTPMRTFSLKPGPRGWLPQGGTPSQLMDFYQRIEDRVQDKVLFSGADDIVAASLDVGHDTLRELSSLMGWSYTWTNNPGADVSG